MSRRVPTPTLVSDISPAIVSGRAARVARAVRYLERAFAAEHGCASWTADNEDFDGRTLAPREYFSTMIASQLLLDADQNSTIVTRALRLVAKSCNPRGWMHFFENWNLLPADIDCTGVGHALMLSVGHPHVELSLVVDRLLRNVTAGGIMEVYEQPSGVHEGRLDAAALVNALYLVYWAEREAEAQPSLAYVHEHLTSGAFEHGTRYYPSGDTFLYFLSRLLRDFERAQSRFLEPLHEILLRRFGAETCVLTRATRVAAADNVGLFDPDDLKAVADAQRPDGSWPPGAFFKYGRASRYFGSEGVTTAFALRALVAGPKMHLSRSWFPEPDAETQDTDHQVTRSNAPRASRRSRSA
ncbi:MAG: hypothetical protein JW751_00915 [Polyangiaceae bacterium]|nr:hypothetical protein [Polyangiaceae bacterium]